MLIREAQESDLEAINDIVNWHSEHGFSTFSEATSLEQRRQWFQRFDSDSHLALVACSDSAIRGFACSFAYRGGGVFAKTVETSVYLHPEAMGQGFGSRLYQALF